MARLVIYEEEDANKTIFEVFELSVPRVLIGSSMDNELVLETPEVDAGHASLELRHDQWVLQDLGSSRGTKVNASIVSGPHFLRHNDLIEIGNVKIRFQEMDDQINIEEVKKEEEDEEDEDPADEGPHLSGRVWFATVAGVTAAVLFIILLLLIVADYLDLLNMADLLPGPF